MSSLHEENPLNRSKKSHDSNAEVDKKKTSKGWMGFAFGAAIFFLICNVAIVEITSAVGPLCLFYFAAGGILTGMFYNIKDMIQQKRKWVPQNIIVNG